MKNLIAVLLLLLIVFASCSKLDRGVIIDKWYEEADSGVDVSIDPTTGMPEVEHWSEPEKFVVVIQGICKGDLKERRVYLSKTKYLNVSLGDSLIIN